MKTCQTFSIVPAIVCLIVISLSSAATLCPAGCSCTTQRTLHCEQLRTGFPPITDVDPETVDFIFVNCMFEAGNLSSVPPYAAAESLIIDSCGVTSLGVGNSLSGLIRLESLTIAGNTRLRDIDLAAFGGLAGTLKTINLLANDLRNLSNGSFASLKRLESVDLSGNQNLGDIPIGLFGSEPAPQLRSFKCDRCGLTTIPSGLLERAPMLTSLELNQNNLIGTLQGGRPFRAASNLTYLSLDQSMLSILDVDAFAGLESRLESLRIGHNRIIGIEADTLRRLAGLRYLELDNNMLTTLEFQALPASLFSTSPARSTGPTTGVLLAGNPWACDCELLWMRNLDISVVLDSNQVTCFYPHELKDQSLYKTDASRICPSPARMSASLVAVAAITCSSLGLAALGLTVLYRVCVSRRRHGSRARYSNVQKFSVPTDDSK